MTDQLMQMFGSRSTVYIACGLCICYSCRRRIIATTHMEAVSARKAFPCFDEPAMKARFRLEISRPQHWSSLFNTRLNHSRVYDERRMLDVYGLAEYLVSCTPQQFFISRL